MKEITVKIPEKKFEFFVELLKSLGFIKFKIEEVDEGDSKENIIANIKQGIKEVKLIEQGKMKSRPLKELLDEL